MGTLVGYGILGTLLIGLIATAIICVLIYISDGCIDWGEKVCQFLVCATIIFAFFATGSLWGDLIRNRDEYIKQINDEATVEVDSDTVETTEDAPDMELVKPDNESVDSVDLYYTRSYHTELFSDGTEYYLLISVPNGDYPYKLSNKEYLDIISGEFPESYVVAMSMNNTSDIFMDDTIISLYPVVGKG